MTQDTYQIESFDATNNKVVTRTITPLPTPQRLQPPKPIAKAELTEMIENLRQEMSDQQRRFDNRDSIDKERTTRKNELSAKVAELTAQLRVAESELEDLNRKGSVRDEFIAFVKQFELRITQIATDVFNWFLDKTSQEKYEANHRDLPPLMKEEVTFKANRLGIRGLTDGNFARLHRTPKEGIFNANLEAAMERVYSATEKLEGALSK